MSYTYEVSIICDVCSNQCVAGEPHQKAKEAFTSATAAAKKKGWEIDVIQKQDNYGYTFKWSCPDCAKKEGK